MSLPVRHASNGWCWTSHNLYTSLNQSLPERLHGVRGAYSLLCLNI